MSKINHFWRWGAAKDDAGKTVRELALEGPIASESWYGDEVTPAVFRAELESETGDITVRINSPGGECIAAAQIYNMLREYAKASGRVTVRIDGIAASAASVIAMAGDVVEMSPVGMMMIHDPSSIAWGNAAEMQAIIDMLNEVKESLMNAYELKTSLPRKQIARMMSEETWLNSGKALELGFIDKVTDWANPDGESAAIAGFAFGVQTANEATRSRIVASLGNPTHSLSVPCHTHPLNASNHNHSLPQAPTADTNTPDEAARRLYAARLTALQNAL
ncbi:MAG: Clp protease ClpP [Eubacteriales bacterium]|nr:Clp protease ClpP [Eubacteriales bacterium]